MGFLLQLRLLLWKNFTLKKRTPLVLLFELLIPLALFVILLFIRSRQAPFKIKAGHFNAMPLPSAGVVSILQTFCEGGERDEYGFVNFPKSKASGFLNRLQTAAEHHNFFRPDYTPKEMVDKLPTLYRSIISDLAEIHDKFYNAKDVELASVVNDTGSLRNYITQNLTMPATDADALLHSNIHMKEIYRLLFGGNIKPPREPQHRKRRSTSLQDGLDISDVINDWIDTNTFQTVMQNILLGSADGLIEKIQNLKDFWSAGNYTMFHRTLLQTFKENRIDLNPSQIVTFLKDVLFTPSVLKGLSCNADEFERILKPSALTNISILKDAEDHLCHASDAKFIEISQVLKKVISDSDIIKLLDLQNFNITKLARQVDSFYQEMIKFEQFQMSLYQLSVFAELLPQDACSSQYDNLTTTASTEDDKSKRTNNQDGKTSSEDDGEEDEKMKRKKNRMSSFLKIWSMIHVTLCGGQQHRLKRDANMEDIVNLGISSNQKGALKMLAHIMYSNPKVLYAPNNSAAGDIIKKANETFSLVDQVNAYAEQWMNISSDLRDYFMENSTLHNLKAIQQMQRDLKNEKGILQFFFTVDPRVTDFLNDSIPTQKFLLHELDEIDNAACSWLSMMSGLNFDIFKGFKTERELEDYFLNRAYFDNVSVIGSVVFENMMNTTTLPPHVRYKIRQNASLTRTTKFVRPRYWYPGHGLPSHPYYYFGFVWIQDIMTRAIINLQTGKDVVEPGNYVQEFPYDCELHDPFAYLIDHVMPLVLVISWVYSVAMLVQSIVYEKEQRLKEVMKMMGLSNAVHWLAWFITTYIQMSITVGGVVAIVKFGHILNNSDPLIVFIVFEAFLTATIAFSFLISTIYSKAKVAAACAGIIYFLSYVPYMYVAIKEDVALEKVSSATKIFACLFSTTAFGLGAKYFGYYEDIGTGVQWSNFRKSPLEDDEFSLFIVVCMMALDTILYSVLMWYIENVFPGTYGLPKPWYFPFTSAYWTGNHSKTVEHECPKLSDLFCRKGNTYLSVTEEDQACAMGQNDSIKFEPEPVHLPLGVCVDNLTKVYKSNKKVAVKNLSVNFYEGQITSFLGHNGAGKTTTMSILTGLFPPTDGYALIYGEDIRTDMDSIRQSLGMCPQHNVLFDKLTVEEHLWFYSRLKGMKSEDMKSEMNTMIENIGLPKKRHCPVDCLSGGMQRKLSVAIAFIGGSKVVILDEPTSGVDPYARRAIWDLLVRYKSGRTVILSTHNMDEADILGDRIAIISNGGLKCCGSSLFLKNTFGEGYHLTLVKKEAELDVGSTESHLDESPENSTNTTLHTKCKESTVTEFINKYVNTAYLHKDLARELHYILPFEEAKKGNFEKLFTMLDSHKDQLNVSSYGVMDTTLEEVFLKVTEKAAQEDEDTNEPKEPDSKNFSPSLSSPEPEIGDSQLTNQEPAINSQQLRSRLEDHLHLQRTGRNNTSGDVNSQGVELGHIPNEGLPRFDSDVSLDRAPNLGNRSGEYHQLINEDEYCQITPSVLHGKGSYVLTGYWLKMNHFRAVIAKRFHYITRNWRSLFSQILLPALFISVAMTVALAAPKQNDLPPIELTPTQYFKLTQPDGNMIPFTNEHASKTSQIYLRDAGPRKLLETFHMASGVGATCVLKSPYHTYVPADFNGSQIEYVSSYYEPSCAASIEQNFHYIAGYVPPSNKLIDMNGTSTHSEPYTPSGPKYSKNRYYPHCVCAKDFTGFICDQGGYQNPPSFTVVTKDILQNITGQQTETFLLNTENMNRLHRYGVISVGLEKEFVPETFGKTAPTSFRKLAVRKIAKYLYNNKGFHAIAIYLNVLNNAILRANLPPSKGNPAAYGITVINHPMNGTNHKLSMDYILQGTDVLIAIFIIVAMSFVPASFVVFLVYERSLKAKHIQFSSGIDPIMYWLGNYVWDMCNYMVPATCCIGILLIFHIPTYVSPTNLPAVISLFLLYGWSITPMMYPVSFIFKEPSTAYISMIVINLFTGITCLVSSFLLEIFSYDAVLNRIHNLLKNLFLIFPNYCLGRGLMDIAYNEYKNEFFFKTGQYSKMLSPFEWSLTSKKLVVMAGSGLFFFFITVMIEFRFFIKPRFSDGKFDAATLLCRVASKFTLCEHHFADHWYLIPRHGHIRLISQILQHSVSQAAIQDEDEDVAMERKRVLRGNGKYDMLRLENLTKVYKTRKLGRHLAVDRLCLGVPAGECFGLCGVNGAGKTTTFRMLTGDISPTAGNAYLYRHSVITDVHKIQQNIGYCPQFDSLYDELTAKEHLQLYARLRGIPPKEEKQVVEWALKKLNLMEYKDRPSGTYSGGCKRKLSVAITLIGRPPVIFLDEPTTGMDPQSRRFLWDLISNLIKDGRSVILTSHSMEEVEALSTRLAIMVNGHFKCLGSIQHLKDKYGDGYMFTIKVSGPDYERNKRLAVRFVQRKFPEAELTEHHFNVLKYELGSAAVSLPYLFSNLEEAQKDLAIEDYSVSQNTLDNVFINFVKQQVEIVQEELLSRGNSITFDDREPLLRLGPSHEQALDTDDDELILRLDQPGTRLSMLNITEDV